MRTVKISHGIGRIGLHPYYEDLIRQLPPDVRLAETIIGENKYWKKKGNDKPPFPLQILILFVNALGLPNIWPVHTKADMLYCCQHIPITRKGWVLDLDYPPAIIRYKHSLQRGRLQVWLTNLMTKSDQCKAIVFWSDAAKKTYCSVYRPNKTVQKKMYVIYPGVTQKKKKRNKCCRFLWVANLFHQKGGGDLLSAWKRFHKQHPKSELVMIGDIPKKIQKRHEGQGVFFKQRMPREQLFEEYRNADVFVYPTKMDIFGLVILEALSFQLPVITTKDYCTQEMVKHEINGLLVDREQRTWFDDDGLMRMDCDFDSETYKEHVQYHDKTLVRNLVAAMERMLDTRFRKRMQEGITKELETFDPKHRQEKLKNIFRN